MDWYSLSDKQITTELGQRLKTLRLRKNTTQEALAQAVGLSLNAIKAMEAGRFKSTTLIAVLRHFQALDHLDQFLPAPPISPLQLAKMQGKQRERASSKRGKPKPGKTDW